MNRNKINIMPTMEGSLSKWTNVVNGWQYRWFVLDDNAGLLSYYTSKEKMMRGARRGCVRLRGAIIGIDDEDDSTFTITTSSYKDDPKTFHFQTRNSEERERWIHALEDTIIRHSHTRWDPKKSPPKHDFDRKVAEADAYLQLLIDQMKALDSKQESIDIESTQREQYTAVLTQANVMLNSIKHTIVQLQIAKNTAIPVNGTYTGTSTNSVSPSTLTLVTAQEPESTVETGIELGSECIVEPRMAMLHDRNLPVPQFSYSSSDEDENYYDAADEIPPSVIIGNHERLHGNNNPNSSSSSHNNDNPHHNNNPTSGGGGGGEEEEEQTMSEDSTASSNTAPSRSNKQPQPPPPPPVKNDGSLDYDALYEDESETEMNSMESHGSVVTHLLSQVKIGMDLTKVALPTFILERRSLLEMYADYFAHPDQFVSIADKANPRERMMQVVKWYLCSFHAGRKSGVAKKPYNPILGEIFRCHWNINSIGELKFIAEQVSHHPPVSAFYAEHENKKISFNAHVWTKSKFLGLSVGVHNIGKGIVHVLEHDEEYILTFPNGYGRSILTVPWIELGGTATIQCPQTGYHATVEFLTKPFYGGKRNRIVCQVTQPGDKKPFVVINGEWSGAMEAKWVDGRTEAFADVRELRTQKKLVKPVSEQEDCESRKVWREVTVGLRINDMDKATEAKCQIEQKQRDEARIRKESNILWQTRYFKETKDGGWVYVDPLKERMLTAPEQPQST